MSSQDNIKVSVLLSAYNRSDLFTRGLVSYAKQTMPANEFEIIIIDDGSTEDLSKVYEPYIGRLNIKHIKFDHKKHPIWEQMNTKESKDFYHVPEDEENFFHTPALSTNIGIYHARGEVVSTCQPEIILNEDALKYGYNHTKFGSYQTYGEVILANQQFNDWLRDCEHWYNMKYTHLIDKVDQFGREHTFGYGEYYWILAFYLRERCLEINGVDLEYLKGVYGEDDNFRVRMRMTRSDEHYGGRTDGRNAIDGSIIGIHQSHKHEASMYKKQDREGNYWNIGANINRKRWSEFCQNPVKMANENLSKKDIWGINTIVDVKEYYI